MNEYTFFALRYVHDAVTQEFANVGGVLYSAGSKTLRSRFTTQYRRLSNMFGGAVDGESFRSAVRYVQNRLDGVAEEIGNSMFPAGDLRSMLARVLPEDASSLQFQPIGGGLSADLEATLQMIYARHVARYAERGQSESRTDDDVWKVFRDAFDARNLTSVLTPKRITAPDYDYEFDRAWRNGVWNVYEPVSFDLADGTTILDKANSWLGKATTLSRSSEEHQIYLLVGAPHREGLETAFSRAQNILRRAPDVRIVHESGADQFAARLAREMVEHGVST